MSDDFIRPFFSVNIVVAEYCPPSPSVGSEL